MEGKFKERSYLHDRHRLSHQQIDKLLGENKAADYMTEKVKLLEDVKNLMHVTDLFAQNGIHFVCLKGAILSYRLYKDPAMRISHDIDILVNRDSVGQASDLLLNNGFDLCKGVVWPTQMSQRELILKNEQHLSFLSSSKKCCVEIHWTLMQGLAVTQTQLQTIVNDNLVKECIGGREFPVLSKELELLFLLMHGSRHAWHRLKWLVDIKDYPFDDIDNQKFYDLARKMKAGSIIYQTNYLLKRLFNITVPLKGRGHMSGRFIKYPVYVLNADIDNEPGLKECIRQILYKWYMFNSIYYKYRLLTNLLFRGGDLYEINSSSLIVYSIYRPYSFIKRRVFNAR